jgi:hypothetical protein
MGINKNVLVIPAGIALVAILPLPIGFYTLIRITLFGFGAWTAFQMFKHSNNMWVIFALITILFNPIIPVYLNDKSIWIILDIFTAIAFFWAARTNITGESEKEK